MGDIYRELSGHYDYGRHLVNNGVFDDDAGVSFDSLDPLGLESFVYFDPGTPSAQAQEHRNFVDAAEDLSLPVGIEHETPAPLNLDQQTFAAVAQNLGRKRKRDHTNLDLSDQDLEKIQECYRGNTLKELQEQMRNNGVADLRYSSCTVPLTRR